MGDLWDLILGFSAANAGLLAALMLIMRHMVGDLRETITVHRNTIESLRQENMRLNQSLSLLKAELATMYPSRPEYEQIVRDLERIKNNLEGMPGRPEIEALAKELVFLRERLSRS